MSFRKAMHNPAVHRTLRDKASAALVISTLSITSVFNFLPLIDPRQARSLHPLLIVSLYMKRKLLKFCLIASVVSVFSCRAEEQGATKFDSAKQLTDRSGAITLTVPSNWHDETEQRLAALGVAEKSRGDSGGHAGSDFLLEIKKDEEGRPRGNAGCMFFSLRLPPQYPGTQEATKALVEHVANNFLEGYKKAEVTDFLKRGLSVSILHSTPQQVDLEKSQEIQFGDHGGWEQIWKVWNERARDPLVSIMAAMQLNTQQIGKEHKALIVQCTFTGEESRTPWGGKSPEERIRDLLNTVRINDVQPGVAGGAAPKNGTAPLN